MVVAAGGEVFGAYSELGDCEGCERVERSCASSFPDKPAGTGRNEGDELPSEKDTSCCCCCCSVARDAASDTAVPLVAVDPIGLNGVTVTSGCRCIYSGE